LMELCPFRVEKDGKTLHRNEYAWNKGESPAGVGFSYSNRTSDYKSSGDLRTAQDSYTFLVYWIQRFPEYKTREFFPAGESYVGYYVPQLAHTILQNNQHTNQTIINLKGIAWTHALTSDDIYTGLALNCDYSTLNLSSKVCLGFVDKANDAAGNMYTYDIYAPLCDSSSTSTYLICQAYVSAFHSCSKNYIHSYLNNPEVHKHFIQIGKVNRHWKDKPLTVLPIIKEVMDSGIRVWIYNGDTDGALPLSCSKYAINKLGMPIKTAWYTWYIHGEVGGYAVGYQNLTFVTVRGAGHSVPSYQQAWALVLFSSFLNGKLPPSARGFNR
ncbi:hypothetical protein V6Z11_A03G105300, partial [Gossypium hirsutum]